MKNNAASSIIELAYSEIGDVNGGGVGACLAVTTVASGITIVAGGIQATPFLSATVIVGIASGMASYLTYNNAHNAVLSAVNKMTTTSLIGVMTVGASKFFKIRPDLNVFQPLQKK